MIEGFSLATAYWMGDNSLLCSHETTQTAKLYIEESLSFYAKLDFTTHPKF